MLDLTHWPLDARARTVGVLTDVDDTLTTDGAITPDALQATGPVVSWCLCRVCWECVARGVTHLAESARTCSPSPGEYRKMCTVIGL